MYLMVWVLVRVKWMVGIKVKVIGIKGPSICTHLHMWVLHNACSHLFVPNEVWTWCAKLVISHPKLLQATHVKIATVQDTPKPPFIIFFLESSWPKTHDPNHSFLCLISYLISLWILRNILNRDKHFKSSISSNSCWPQPQIHDPNNSSFLLN